MQLFVDNGVHLGEFVSVRRLRDLYEQCLKDTKANTMAIILADLLKPVSVGHITENCRRSVAKIVVQCSISNSTRFSEWNRGNLM